MILKKNLKQIMEEAMADRMPSLAAEDLDLLSEAIIDRMMSETEIEIEDDEDEESDDEDDYSERPEWD